jgi:phytoene/squalene synthetase
MKILFDELSAQCSKITTRKYSTSFSLGIHFLNKKFHQPVYAIYGFVRFADEIVDSFHDYDKAYLLKKFRNDCFEAIEMGVSLNPILNAFQKVVNEYNIDLGLIRCFLDSMEMDLYPQVYYTQKYQSYIFGSAETVGLMCLKVFTSKDSMQFEKLKPYAMKLGSAFQKINFLRDLKMDSGDLNRNYFSVKDFNSFSNTKKKSVEKEIETELEDALKGIRQLPVSSRQGVYLSYVYYKSLFNKIKKCNAERIMNERIRISNGQKFALIFNSMIAIK